MNRIIDTHLHFWDVDRFDYHWMKPGTPLHHNFLPEDISAQAKKHGVEGYVVIEATNASPEIPWLLDLAAQDSLIQGVVGGIDFVADSVSDVINKYAHNPVFKGIRLNWRQPQQSVTNLIPLFQALVAHQLSCDLLCSINVLPEIQAVAQNYPQVSFILNHLAGATLTPGGHTAWRDVLRPLTDLPNIAVKVSGFLTSGDPKPLASTTLQAYLETALTLFGSERLMYASNFPINILISAEYGDSIMFLQSVINELSQDEQFHLWSGTAQRVYKLLSTPS